MYVGMEKGIKYTQDWSSILILLNHNFRYAFNCNAHKHNAQIFEHNVTNPRVYGIAPAGLKNLKIKAKTR